MRLSKLVAVGVMALMLRYVASPTFAPKSELDAELLKKLLPGGAR